MRLRVLVAPYLAGHSEGGIVTTCADCGGPVKDYRAKRCRSCFQASRDYFAMAAPSKPSGTVSKFIGVSLATRPNLAKPWIGYVYFRRKRGFHTYAVTEREAAGLPEEAAREWQGRRD